MGKNIPALKRGFHYDPLTGALEVWVDGVKVESYLPPPTTQTYYVDVNTGLSTNDGLTWGSAVDELDTAATLSQAYHLARYGETADLYYRCNNIIIQQSYTATMGEQTGAVEWANIIGLGQGRGRTQFGSSTASGYENASHNRFCNWLNHTFQFGGSGNYGYYCGGWTIGNIFEDCTFVCSGTGATAGAYIESSQNTTFKDCYFTTNTTSGPTYGLYMKDQNSNNRITGCFFGMGGTAMLYLHTGGTQTLIDYNYFNPANGQTCAVGFYDNTLNTEPMFAYNCFAVATTGDITDLIKRTGDSAAHTVQNYYNTTGVNS